MARPKVAVHAPKPESWVQRTVSSSVPKRDSWVEKTTSPVNVASTEPRGHQQALVEDEAMNGEQPLRAAIGVPPTPLDQQDNYRKDKDAAMGIKLPRPQFVGAAVFLSNDTEPICLSSGSEGDDSGQGPEDVRVDLGATSDAGASDKKRCEHSSVPSFHCTICLTQMFAASEIHEHPKLCGVGICRVCFNFLFSGPYTKDNDGTEEHCRWCGEGGDTVLCDNCDKVFCTNCIVRNYGRKRGLTPILNNSNWSCFCCSPKTLHVHVDRLQQFLRLMPPGINSFVKRGNAEDSIIRGQSTGGRIRGRVVDAGRQSSDGNPGNRGGCATIAELLTRMEEVRRNQDDGIQTDFHKNNSGVKHTEVSEVQETYANGKRAGKLDRQHTAGRARRRRRLEARRKQEQEQEQEAEKAPPVPPARTWIRPHQMRGLRQEAAERRARAEAERLKGDDLRSNLPSNDRQHRDSVTQATTEIPGTKRQLPQSREGEPDADPGLLRESASPRMVFMDLTGEGGGAEDTKPIGDANLHAAPKFCF